MRTPGRRVPGMLGKRELPEKSRGQVRGEGGPDHLGWSEGSAFSLREVESCGPDLYFKRITVAKNKL